MTAAWPEAGLWEDAPILGDADAPPYEPCPPAPEPLPRWLEGSDDDETGGIIPAWAPLPAVITQRPLPGSSPSAGHSDRRSVGHGDGGPAARRVTGLLDLTLTWHAFRGDRSGAATLSRIGPITASQAWKLALYAALDPHAQWRLILTDGHGHAIAVERVRRRHTPQPGRPPGVTGRVTIVMPAATLDTDPPPEPNMRGGIEAAILRAARRAKARAARQRAADAAAPGGCAHTTATAAYRPPPRIRELVEARDRTCRQPTCRQPAAHTDLDHTIPHHMGGLTCPCDLGPFCRTHHQVKQEPGWTVVQPRPGTFHITTPGGRTYTVEPDIYPA